MKRIHKLINRYKTLSAPLKASFWFTICNILQKGISLLSTPIFTRLLTTEQYGIYSVYQSWYQIISIFATLNLYAGVFNNGLTKYNNDRKRFTSAMQGLSTTITCILFVIYLCNIDFWNIVFELPTIFMLSIFVEVLFVPAFNFWSTSQRYDYHYKKLVAVTLIIALISPLLGVVLVFMTEHKAEARVLSYAFVQICVGLIFYIYNAKCGKKFFHKNYWKFALAFNLPLIPHYLSLTILNQADRIMISRMFNSNKAAIYSVVYNISMIMTIVTTAINNSFVPFTYKSMKEKKYREIRKSSNALLILVVGTCVITIAFGPEILRVIAAPDYYEARWVIPPVATALIFKFIFPFYSNIEFYYEKTKFIMVASCIGAVVNIALNYFFMNIFGYIAAAYTTLFCYILFCIAHYIMYKFLLQKEAVIDKIYDDKFILFCSIASIVIMVLMTLIYDHTLTRYGVVIVICILAYIKRKDIQEQLKLLRK